MNLKNRRLGPRYEELAPDWLALARIDSYVNKDYDSTLVSHRHIDDNFFFPNLLKVNEIIKIIFIVLIGTDFRTRISVSRDHFTVGVTLRHEWARK